jgi:hypothetical protein
MQRFLTLFTLILFVLTCGTAQTITIGTEANLGSDITGSLPITYYHRW